MQTGPGAHPASCTVGTRSFPGVKCGRGILLTTHPLLVLRSWKSRAIPLPTLWATTGPLTGSVYLLLNVSPVMLYGKKSVTSVQVHFVAAFEKALFPREIHFFFI